MIAAPGLTFRTIDPGLAKTPTWRSRTTSTPAAPATATSRASSAARSTWLGVEALSQWEGFGRFCRRSLGVEPLTLLKAYGVDWEDPAAEILAVYPDAKFDEARAAHWEGNWAREWERRFGGR